MFRLLVAACLAYVTVALAFRAELDGAWTAFKTTYDKGYSHGEEVLRRMIWERNVRYIDQHNQEADKGGHTYWLGVNQLADMTVEEVTQSLMGFNQSAADAFTKCGHYKGPADIVPDNLPAAINWTAEGYVTPIKDQGQCASDWAMSTTGSLEGQHFRKTHKLVSLSEKNLMDCSTSHGNQGCRGGLVDLAIAYIINNGGIDTEASYPYVAQEGTCKFNRRNVGATASACKDIKQFSEADLQMAIAMEGPISVAIDSTHQGFIFYRSGVYKDDACSSTKLCHAVLAVGYGTLDGVDYWLVKNSWSWQWGDNGYIKMARNYNNMCGIATKASFPTV